MAAIWQYPASRILCLHFKGRHFLEAKMFIQHFQVIRIYPVIGTGEEYGLSENPALPDMYIHLGQEIHADEDHRNRKYKCEDRYRVPLHIHTH